MEIKGKLQIILPVTEGTSKNGTWKKQEFVVETNEGKFPKQIHMNVWGADKVDEFKRYKIGDILTFSLDISSREYNGRWYSDIRAWKIQAGGGTSTGGGESNDYVSVDNGINSANNNWEGDLPF